MLTSACVVAVMILFFSARLICSVRSINVYGNGAKKADIIAYSQLTKGMCMFDIDEAEVENHIEEKAPYIQADVQRLWLNKIDIKISNRIPYAAIECNAQYLIIDNEFVSLEFIPKEQLSKYDLVVVRGLQSGNFQLSKKIGDEKSNAHIYDLNAMLEMINNADNSLKIVEVDVLNSNNLTCKTSDGLTILFGDSSDLDKKLATACEIIPLLSKQGLGKGVLDVRESGLYRKTKEETENTPVPAKSDDAIPKSGTVEPSQSGGA